MPSTDSARILRLKIGDKSVQDAGLAGATKRAFRLALARAGQSFSDLDITLKPMEQAELPLEAMVEALSEARAIFLTTGPKDRQGVAVMDAALMASAIEKATTGAVRSAEPETRRPTRTDMALCADLLNAILREVSIELAEIPQAPQISDFHYERALTDPAGVELILENDFYHLCRLRLGLADGARIGELVLCFQAANSVVGAGALGRKKNWDSEWREQVDHMPVRVQAIMHRMKMPLSKLSKLKPGDMLELPRTRLEQVVLTGANQKPVARGKLGRQGMNRAIRIHDVGTEAIPQGPKVEAFDIAEPLAGAPAPVDVPSAAAAPMPVVAPTSIPTPMPLSTEPTPEMPPPVAKPMG